MLKYVLDNMRNNTYPVTFNIWNDTMTRMTLNSLYIGAVSPLSGYGVSLSICAPHKYMYPKNLEKQGK